MKRTGTLAALAVFLLVSSTLLAQSEESLSEMFERLVAAKDSAQVRVDLGLSCLEKLKGSPDPVQEMEVRLAIGIALTELERFRDAREQFRAAEKLARKVGDKEKLAFCLWDRALVSYRLGDAEDAIAAANESIELAEPGDQFNVFWRASNILGLTLERTGDYDAALEAFSRGLKAAEESDDFDGIAALVGNIGMAMMNLGEYEQARDFYFRALEIDRKANNERSISTTLANLGDVHLMLDEIAKAIEYHEDALRLREKLGIESEISRSQHSIGAIHFTTGDFELALQHFEKALEIEKRLEMAPEQAQTLLAMAYAYAGLDRDEEAFDSVRSSIDLADRFELKRRRLEVLESLATVYQEQGEYAKALEIFHEAVMVEREERSLETRQCFSEFEAEFEAKYEAREKEQQIALLTKEKELQSLTLKEQSLLRNALVFGSLLLAGIAVAGWFAWAALRRSHRELAGMNARLTRVNADLDQASRWIKDLEGILPVCAFCKNVRDGKGTWHRIESYIAAHSAADFSHSVCPVCAKDNYPEHDPLPAGN